jgi:hypothetical protein
VKYTSKDKLALVTGQRFKVTKANLELIDKVCSEDFDEDSFIDSLIAFEDINRQGKNSTEMYIKAVQFCSYVVTGSSYTDAYRRTFPDRAVGKEGNTLTAFSSSYANGRLVKDILQRMTLNNNLLFMDKEFKARKKLFEIGMSGDGKTNVEALKVFLDNQYREKDKAGFEVNFNVGDTSAIDSVNDAITRLAEKQKESIERGTMSLKEVAEGKIIKVDKDYE